MAGLIPYMIDNVRLMYFVDGENLAIRYGAMLKDDNRLIPELSTIYEPNVFVWSHLLNEDGHGIIRKYYYTSIANDGIQVQDIESRLKLAGVESPKVFPKSKAKGSKRVDIALATDMLVHATRHHYDIAILVAGDEDYVPLVRAVQAEGARVHVWFVSNGISPHLKTAADSFLDISNLLANAAKEL